MSKVEDIPTITTEQGRALREADYLVFHYNKEGRSYIRAGKENIGVWKETKEIEIDCGVRFVTYRSGSNLGDVYDASCVISHAKSAPHIVTVLQKIKKGDKLVIRWVANNNNQYVTRSGLYNDELYLEVHKPSGKFDSYFIAYSTCENNSAKMVRHNNTPRASWEQ